MAPQKPRYGGARNIMAEGKKPTQIAEMETWFGHRRDLEAVCQRRHEQNAHRAAEEKIEEREIGLRESTEEEKIHKNENKEIAKGAGQNSGINAKIDPAVSEGFRQPSIEVEGCLRERASGYEKSKKKDVEAGQEQKDLVISDIEKILKVFNDLGIDAPIKPYLRKSNGDTGSVNGVSEVLQSRGTSCANRDLHCGDAQSSSLSRRPLDLSTLDKDLISTEFCKNILLKDRRGQLFLVIVPDNEKVDLKVLKQELEAYRNFSFADEALLWNTLKVLPGSVTPLAIMHESAKNVKIAIHESLRSSTSKLAFHPLDGSLQVEIYYWQLLKFLGKFDKTPTTFGFSSRGEGNLAMKQNEATKKAVQGNRNQEHSIVPSMLNAENNATLQDVAGRECKSSTISGDSSGEAGAILTLKNSRPLIEPNHVNASPANSPSCEIQQSEGTDKSEKEKNEKIRGGLTWFNRKGKLRSYVKKLCTAKEDCENGTSTAEQNSGETLKDIIVDSSEQLVSTASFVSYSDAYPGKGKLESTQIQRTNANSVLNHQCRKMLPEVENFLRSLKMSDVIYRDIDLSSEDSKSMGPSVGCRCFFLKDKRQNFYFLISHEFYELDYGRLKKALQPRKKLDVAEPAEIMRILGVDATRMTPFACFSAPVKDAFKVFLTQKIHDDKVVLSVQHPFATGHRILVRSSQLKSYLTEIGTDFSVVEEKKWAPRPDTIFTQFDSCTSTLPDAPGIPLDMHQKQNITAMQSSDSTGKDKVFICSSSRAVPTAGVKDWTGRNVIQFVIGTISKLFIHDDPEPLKCIDKVESSVDPPLDFLQNRQRGSGNNLESPINFSSSSLPKGGVQPGSYGDYNLLLQHNLLKQPILSLENLQAHLRKHQVDFSAKQHLCGRKVFQQNESLHHQILNSDNLNNDDNDDGNEDEDSYKDIEDCNVIHLRARSGTHFLIIASKDEYISNKRFSRKFRIGEGIEVLFNGSDSGRNRHHQGENGQDYFLSQQLPFNLALFKETIEHVAGSEKMSVLHGRSSPASGATCSSKQSTTSRQPELLMDSWHPDGGSDKLAVTVVLTTPMYMDPDTTIRFQVSDKGDQIYIKSEEFQSYAQKVGFEVWFM